MYLSLPIIQNYLAPAEPTFWSWSEDAEAVVGSSGEVLVFRMDLAETLEAIGEGGLPPLGAVIMLIAASKSNATPLRQRHILHCTVAAHERKGQLLPAGLLDSVLDKLESFCGVMTTLKDPALVKTAIEMVFEGGVTEVASADAKILLGALRAAPAAEMLKPRGSREALRRLFLDLRTLDKGLDRITEDAVRRRHATGLESTLDVEEPAEVALPEPEDALRLIGTLEQHPDHAPLGYTARFLLSAIRLPSGLGQPQDLPLGGVSRIANRGRLDRLLLSELANDSLTLAVRVANNEALYLHREESNAAPPTRRHVLVDVGLAQWGVPRLITAAMLLALQAGREKHVELQTWCATYDGVDENPPIDQNNLEEFLARLELNTDPVAALNALAGQIEPGQISETVVVSSQKAIDSSELVGALQAFDGQTIYLIGVDRSGRVEVVARTPRGVRRYTQTQVDIESLLTQRPSHRESLIDETLNGDWPAAVRQRRLPLRVPHQIKFDAAWFCPVADCVYAVTKNQCLVRWTSRSRGPEELTAQLPAANVLWRAHHQHSDVDAVIGRLTAKGLVYALSIDHAQGTVTTVRLQIPEDETHWQGIFVHRGLGVAVGSAKAYVFDLASGTLLSSRYVRENSYVIGFKNRHVQLKDRTWLGLSTSGNMVITVPVQRSYNEAAHTAFYSQAHEGPVSVSSQGVLELHGSDSSPQRLMSTQGYVNKVSVAPDGDRAVVHYSVHRSKPQERFARITVEKEGKATVENCGYDHAPEWLFPEVMKRCYTRSTRVKFQGVAVAGKDRRLVLLTRKGMLGLIVDRTNLVAVRYDAVAVESRNNFKPMSSPPEKHFSLSVAELGECGRVVLDSRGILHLQPRDKSIPEVSLVIEGDKVSGWCADGRVFGDDYFLMPINIAQGKLVTGEAIMRTVIEPMLGGRP